MILIQVMGAFIAVVAFSALLYVSKKHLIYSGIAGAVGWFVYLLLEPAGVSIVMRNFAAALSVAALSHLFARKCKAPVTIFLVSGILPIVPGAGMYRIAYHILSGENQLASFYLTQTIQIAGVIALAVFITDSFFRVFQKE